MRCLDACVLTRNLNPVSGIQRHGSKFHRAHRMNYRLMHTVVLLPEPVGANCENWLSIYRVLEEHTMCGSSLYLIVLHASVQCMDSAHACKRWPYGYLSVSRQRLLHCYRPPGNWNLKVWIHFAVAQGLVLINQTGLWQICFFYLSNLWFFNTYQLQSRLQGIIFSYFTQVILCINKGQLHSGTLSSYTYSDDFMVIPMYI